MKKFSCKKLLTTLALSMSLALTVPSVLPVVSTVATVEAATAPTLNQSSLSLRAGEVVKLKISNKGKNKVTWTTNNKKVATVKNGVVTAAGKGSAVVTAKVGKTKLKCIVFVSDNSYSLDLNTVTGFFTQESVYIIPTKVYYKNGNLYCKVAVINQELRKIEKFGNKKRNDISKLDVVLTGLTYTSKDTHTDTIFAKGKVKNTLPSNIPSNGTKYFTVEFSGNQIREKGYDLNNIDLFDLSFSSKVYYFLK